MYILLSLIFTYRIFSISFYPYSFYSFGIVSNDYKQENSRKELLNLEKKVVKDFLYKKMKVNILFSDIYNFEVFFLDKESKILGNKKKFECTQQKLILPLSENKKFLKSTLFGVIRIVKLEC